MNEIDTLALKNQIDAQGRMLSEIRDALLGSLDGNNIGLIADHRNLKQLVDSHNASIAEHSHNIAELQTFRKDLKKMVAMVAFAIPFAFEIIKGLLILGWEYLKNLGHK